MNNPKTRIENIVVQDFENEVLIYDLTINKAFCLNQTSAMVWSLCDGKNSVAEISQIMNRKLNEPITEDLVWLALDQFKRDNLLENNELFEINFKGLSRRQVIKKVGFASMVALPVIASVVAPSAVMAQSGLALFSPCSAPSQCASGNCLSPTPAVPTFNSPPGPICCNAGTEFTPGSSASGSTCVNSITCDVLSSFRCCGRTGIFTPSACPSNGICICT